MRTGVALAALTAAFGLTLLVDPWADERVSDLHVFRPFAAAVLDGALPYRELLFEYPPLALAPIVLPALAGPDAETYRLAFAAVTLVMAAGVALLTGGLAARTGGSRARALLAVAAAPLLTGAMLRTHFDLLPVALTLAALLLLVAKRPRTGFVVLGVGVLVKGFPLVVAPVALAWLVGRGERRAAATGAAALCATVAAGAVAAAALSPSGALGAVRYHLERPVQVESLPATMVGALDGLGLGAATSVHSHRSDGLLHLGSGAIAAGFAALLAVTVAYLAFAAARGREPRRLVLAALAAVCAFAAFGKVLSPQFMVWLLPLAALAFAWRLPALATSTAAAIGLTLGWFPSRYAELVDREPLPLALVTIRNALLVVALLLAVRALSPGAAAARSRWPARPRRPRPAPR